MKKNLLLLCLLAICASTYARDFNVLVSTQNTSLLLGADKGGELRFDYYGDKIAPEQIEQIVQSRIGMNRAAYPVFGVECARANAMQAVHADGNMTLDLGVTDVAQSETEQGTLTVVTMRDKVYPFTVTMNLLACREADIIEMWTTVSHTEKKAVTLQRFDSGVLPVRRGDVWVSHLHGAWASETAVTTEPLTAGTKVISNRDGSRNAQNDHPEVMISLDGRPRENQGRVIGAALCWSGNYNLRLVTEDNTTHTLFAGIDNEASDYKLEPKEVFTTPRLAVTYSTRGLGGVSRNYHRWARAGQIHGGDKLRDILLNSWEGVYFNITEEVVDRMMGDFADLGGELFVLDDGWFGGKYPRNDDHTSLGDWSVNAEKLPHGIDGLLATARKHGLKFGIWIEPESVNKISELYEKHPDWAIRVAGREPSYGRGGTQLLLDLSNPKVQDFAFGIVDELMTKHPDIAYIKWDANATLKNYGSAYLPADKQSHLYVAYHRGLANVIARVRAKYPNLVMQACGGGGGRVNYGVMPGFDEFWVSDNTDALQRIYMQWGTSYFYPAIAMAQHVSASPNHQTGRTIPIKFRFDVAMTGRLGMEMQPAAMNDAEKAFARTAIATYKQIRPIVQTGEQYRLISPYDRVGEAALMYTTADKGQAVLFVYKMEHYVNQMLPTVRLDGLDETKTYRIRELNVPADGRPCYLDGKEVSGKLLMQTGLNVPLGGEYASRVLELTVTDK
ncbi:MAG: alpha-galactosidase [Prevotellaceae bacterium]|jgi:alpha-galactosidase|nr:alpha-galactosidase [Prevotellaceae bacterium]